MADANNIREEDFGGITARMNKECRITSPHAFVTLPQAPNETTPAKVWANIGSMTNWRDKILYFFAVRESGHNEGDHRHLHWMMVCRPAVKKGNFSFGLLDTVNGGKRGNYQRARNLYDVWRYLLKEQGTSAAPTWAGTEDAFVCKEFIEATGEFADLDPWQHLLVMREGLQVGNPTAAAQISKYIWDARGDVSNTELDREFGNYMLIHARNVHAFRDRVRNSFQAVTLPWKALPIPDQYKAAEQVSSANLPDKVRLYSRFNQIVPALLEGKKLHRDWNVQYIYGVANTRKTSFMLYVGSIVPTMWLTLDQPAFLVDGVQFLPQEPRILVMENFKDELISITTLEVLSQLHPNSFSNVKGGKYQWKNQPMLVILSNRPWKDRYLAASSFNSNEQHVDRAAYDAFTTRLTNENNEYLITEQDPLDGFPNPHANAFKGR